MSKQIRVYNDMQTAMKNCKFRVILSLDNSNQLNFTIYKEKINYMEGFLVIENYTKPNEIIIGRFDNEQQAREYGETLVSMPQYALKLYNNYSSSFKSYKTFPNLKDAYENSVFFVTEGHKGFLHVNKSIILQLGESEFNLCYPTSKELIRFSSSNRKDCVEFIRREGGR